MHADDERQVGGLRGGHVQVARPLAADERREQDTVTDTRDGKQLRDSLHHTHDARFEPTQVGHASPNLHRAAGVHDRGSSTGSVPPPPGTHHRGAPAAAQGIEHQLPTRQPQRPRGRRGDPGPVAGRLRHAGRRAGTGRAAPASCRCPPAAGSAACRTEREHRSATESACTGARFDDRAHPTQLRVIPARSLNSTVCVPGEGATVWQLIRAAPACSSSMRLGLVRRTELALRQSDVPVGWRGSSSRPGTSIRCSGWSPNQCPATSQRARL